MKLIEDAFRKQYQESIKNPAKTLDGHIANENNVANDYRGRVLYEFFQNAVDRAESNIWVYMDLAARTLSIANDGKPFSIEKDTDRKYSDFESLCSINTSSKNQNESIGNKGVGFKSCWEYTKRATVVSKHKGFPWGFELKNPFVFMDIEQIDFENILEIKTWLEDESIKAVINKDEKGKVPSFYFPRRLPDSEVESFFSKYPEAQTIITLHDIETTKCDDLIARIDDFSRHEIFFVKQLATLQDKDLTLHIQVDDQDRVEIKTECNENEWLIVNKDTSTEENELLRKLSKDLNYEVSNPKISIAFPLVDSEGMDPRYYTYLPTEMHCGFNVHIHADFLLDVSRKNIDFKSNAYNQKLLEYAAGLLVDTLLSNPKLHQLEHFAKFLMPHDKADTLSKYVWDELTAGDKLKSLLRKVYSGQSSERSCRLVFDAMDKWKDERGYGEWKDGYYTNVYDKTIRHFCDSDIKIVFVNDGYVTSLPEKPRTESEEKRKLFYIAKGVDQQSFSLLQSINSIALSDMPELSRPELIRNRIVLENSNIEILRALAQESENADSESVRQNIIKFVMTRQKDFTGQLNVEHFTAQGNKPKEGHFLARIMLPCRNNEWYSAGNCYFGLPEGIKCILNDNHFHEVDMDRFSIGLNLSHEEKVRALRYFGATDHLPVTKIEKGQGKKRSFVLPWRASPKIKGETLKRLINQAMVDWDLIPEVDQLYRLLCDDNWFYDERHKAFYKPAETFLFNDDVTRPAISQERRNDDLHRLYSNLQIHSIDLTEDNQKLLNQLEKLRSHAIENGIICKHHKTLYKQLTLRLSRNKFAPTTLPLLSDNRYVDGPVWFANRDTKKFKHYFELDFILFDDEVTRSFINGLAAVRIFNPEFHVKPDGIEESWKDSSKSSQTKDFKKNFEDAYLAELFAIADESLPVNLFSKELALSRWQNLEIWYAEDVWLSIALNGSDKTPVSIGENEVDKDIFFLPLSESERNNKPTCIGELVHDLNDPMGHLNFPKFGEAVANGVFRNLNLGPVLRSFLAEAKKGDGYRDSFLIERGITKSDVQEMQMFIRESLLSESERSEFISQLRNVCGKVTKNNWNELSAYEECGISFHDIQKATSSNEKFLDMISQIDPTKRNFNLIKSHQVELQLSYFIEKKKQLLDSEFEDRLRQLQSSRQIQLFDFRLEDILSIFEIERIYSEDDLMEAKIRLRDGIDEFDMTPKKTSRLNFRPQSASISSSDKVSVVCLSNNARESQNLSKQRRGVSTETLYCINYAKRIMESGLTDELKETLCFIDFGLGADVQKTYLSHVEAVKPDNIEGIVYVLQVSTSIGDGLGFDILEPVINNGHIERVNKVEVKSSKGHEAIYLTRNELQKILNFAEKKDDSWRLYHVVDGNTNDRTDIIKEFVLQYKDKMDGIPLYLKPDTWIADFSEWKG